MAKSVGKAGNISADRISKKELFRLIDELSNSRKEADNKIALSLLVQYATALRYNDLEQISVNDILTKKSITFIEGKTKKERVFKLDSNNRLKKMVEKIVDNAAAIGDFDSVKFYSIQYVNRKLKQYRVQKKIVNTDGDGDFSFSTHTARKTSLYEIYANKGINASLQISQHSSIKIHLKYICFDDDIKEAYNCLF